MLAILYAEITQRVIINPDRAQDPEISNIGFAPPVQLAGTADSVQSRQQPQRDKNLRCNCRAARRTIRDFDITIKRLQVQGIYECPHVARSMVWRQHLLQRKKLHLDLSPMGSAHAGRLRGVGGVHGDWFNATLASTQGSIINAQPIRESSAGNRRRRSRVLWRYERRQRRSRHNRSPALDIVPNNIAVEVSTSGEKHAAFR